MAINRSVCAAVLCGAAALMVNINDMYVIAVAPGKIASRTFPDAVKRALGLERRPAR